MLSSTHQFMNKTGSGENRAKAPEDSQNQLESTLAWPVLVAVNTETFIIGPN